MAGFDKGDDTELAGWLSEVAEALQEAVAVFDSEDRLVFCNDAYRQIYPGIEHELVAGAPYDDIVRKAIENGIVPEAADDPEAWIARRKRDRRNPPPPYEARRGDRWVEIIDRRLSSGGLVCLRSDVTEARRHEAALRDSEKRFRDFALASAEWLWETDAQHRFEFVWPERTPDGRNVSTDYLGKTREEALGERLAPETAARLRHIIDRHEPFRDFSLTHLGDDGPSRWLRLNGVPVFDEDGRFDGYRGTGRDVTEHVRAELALTQSRDHLQLVIDAVPSPVLYYDTQMVCRFANRAAIEWLGQRWGALLGRSIDEILTPDEKGKVSGYHARALAGEFVTFETRVRYPDGITRDIEASYTPDIGDDGDVRGFVIVTYDVSERNRIAEATARNEAHLRQVEQLQLIGQLTGGIAHDFNNLLTVIGGNLSLLEGRLGDDETAMSMLAAARRGATHGADLVTQLMAVARRQVLHPKAVDVAEAIRRMASLLRRMLPPHIEIAVDVAPDLPPAFVDGPRLEDALLNLAINARDAMPNGGQLHLSGRAAAADPDAEHGVVSRDHCVVVVSDDGTGISEEVLRSIYEPFFTTKPVGSGSGLGLAMVKGFVEQSGGEIRISTELGVGSSFELLLPLAADQPPDALAAAGDTLTGGGETILVVEDDDDIRAYALKALTKLGYRPIGAADGNEALRIIDAGATISMLFTDMMLPGGLEGPDLAERVRERLPDLPVLFTSGNAERFANAQLSHPLLKKPYDLAQLSLRLHAGLRGDNDGDVTTVTDSTGEPTNISLNGRANEQAAAAGSTARPEETP